MKVQEAIKEVNGRSYFSIFTAEEAIKGKVVVEHMDLDEHRWYSIATRVIQVEDGFVGIRGAYQSFSEQQDWTDINVKTEAFEMEEVPSVYYKRKD